MSHMTRAQRIVLVLAGLLIALRLVIPATYCIENVYRPYGPNNNYSAPLNGKCREGFEPHTYREVALLEAVGVAVLAGVVFVILPGRGHGWGGSEVARGCLPGCLTGIAGFILALWYLSSAGQIAESGFGALLLGALTLIVWGGLYGLWRLVTWHPYKPK